MRVRDQEIIVKKVVKALEEKGLQDLETRFGNHSQVKFLEDLVEEFITVKKKLSKLRDQEDALQKSIDKGVEDFNKEFDLDNTAGLQFANGYRYNTTYEHKVYFSFNTDWDKKSDIADALALQTLGSVFNVQDLIANLIAEFS